MDAAALAPSLTFGALAECWLSALTSVEPANEARHLRHLQALWTLTPQEVTPRRVREALRGLLRPVGTLGASTVNKVRSTARRLVRDAQIDGDWPAVNPFDVVPRLRETAFTPCVLSLQDVRCALPHLTPGRRREVLVMLLLGCRPGELKALRKEDLDVRARSVRIHRSNGRDRTKTGRVRVVPAPPMLWRLLVDAAHASPTEYLFPGPGGRRQRADTKLTRALRAALAAGGVVSRWRYLCRRHGCGYWTDGPERLKPPPCPVCGFRLWRRPLAPPVRWYDLRHASATCHIEAGCAPSIMRLALGHSPVDSAEAHYLHPSVEFVRKELGRLPRALRRMGWTPSPGRHTGRLPAQGGAKRASSGGTMTARAHRPKGR